MTESAPAGETLRRLERHFHDVIMGRAADLVREHALTLPALHADLLGESNSAWFAVPGMYGGFKYWLEWRASGPVLISESWCRVVGGSGQRHLITLDGATLEAEGFV